MICVVSPFSIPLGFSPVPITMASYIICLAAMVLGPLKGTLSCLMYLFLGAIGLPVFSGFSGGIHRLVGPTGGYLIGYLLMAFIAGRITKKYHRKWYLCLSGLLVGVFCCYVMGTIWLCLQLQLSAWNGLCLGVFPYIPADIIKMVLATFTGIPIRRTLYKNIILHNTWNRLVKSSLSIIQNPPYRHHRQRGFLSSSQFAFLFKNRCFRSYSQCSISLFPYRFPALWSNSSYQQKAHAHDGYLQLLPLHFLCNPSYSA